MLVQRQLRHSETKRNALVEMPVTHTHLRRFGPVQNLEICYNDLPTTFSVIRQTKRIKGSMYKKKLTYWVEIAVKPR